MSKKIVFFTGAMGRGGAERVISILSEYYYQKGWQVSIGMVLHDVVGYSLSDGIKIVRLASDKGVKKGLFEVLHNIRRFLKDEKPNVVVAFMAQVCLLVGVAGIGIKKRMVVSERIDPAKVKRNLFYRFLLNRIYESADAVILQTERAKSYFNKKIQRNSYIIANPIRVYVTASATQEHKIVTAGRLTEQKNHKLLIDAFATVTKKYPEYILEIYGEGALLEELVNHAKNLNMSDRVVFKGNVADLHCQIANAELFVLSSDFEGLSNALLEAMMMGLPCISTDCAGSDEVIAHEKNGLLVPVGDAESLSGAMLRLIEDKKFAHGLGEGAKLNSEKYKTENIIDQWRTVIED